MPKIVQICSTREKISQFFYFIIISVRVCIFDVVWQL